jgi:sporulation protein YlmC with PRC-barrel domain
MNKSILVIAGLSLASGLAVAQEQEDQAFNPNRDIVTEPNPDPQTSMGEQSHDTAVQSDYGTEPEPTQGSAAQSTSSTTSDGSMGEGLSAMTADELEGKKVVTLTGEEIGEIGEVGESSAHSGRIATVEVGGFLGIGEKTIAIPLSELDKSVADEDSVRTSLTRASIESEAEFDDSGFTPDE